MLHSARIQYHQGDHVCTLFNDREEQLAAAIEYIRGGLARDERCLYICCEQTADEFRCALRAAGIDTEKEEARGALVLLTKEEGHLKGGTFDPERMITMLRVAVADALAAGFNGLAAAGDMTWLLDEAEGSDRVNEYEARLNAFYPSSRALGLCQYNRNRLASAALDHGIATHPHIRVDGNILLANPFYEPPDEAAVRRSDGGRLRTKLEWLKSAVASVLSGNRPSEPAMLPIEH